MFYIHCLILTRYSEKTRQSVVFVYEFYHCRICGQINHHPKSLTLPLAPPFTYDLLTSLLITAPIIILYNLSIFAVLYRHAKIQKEKHRAFCANISKSSENSVLSTANLSFESIADEIISEEKTNPVVTNTNQQPAMDIMPIIIQSKQTVQPADWVIERKRRQMELNKKVKVFSDIRREPNINHVLASQ